MTNSVVRAVSMPQLVMGFPPCGSTVLRGGVHLEDGNFGSRLRAEPGSTGDTPVVSVQAGRVCRSPKHGSRSRTHHRQPLGRGPGSGLRPQYLANPPIVEAQVDVAATNDSGDVMGSRGFRASGGLELTMARETAASHICG